MKNFLLLLSLMLFCVIVLNTGCKKKKETPPCDNKGTLCIENKLDSKVVITIQPSQAQFDLAKDYMHCSELTGDQTYNINISATGIERDTSIAILSCDKKLLIIQ
jgi:hypothetical protein